MALLAVILLIITSSGIAGWMVLHQPPKAGYVTTTDEYAVGSLRWAISNAHARDTITFDPNLTGKTIVLRNASLLISQRNLTILGPVTGQITLRLIGATLTVDQPASVNISHLAFQENNTQNQPATIQNEGTLTLTHCAISGNTITGTGGVFNDGGTLTMINSTVSGNSAQDDGGGITNSGTFTMINSTVSGNSAQGGGGIYNNGTFTMTNSTVSGNSAPTGYAGGISNDGTFTMINSTVSGNSAQGGGGISNYGIFTMTNSTVSGNSAHQDYGGGILNTNDTTISNSDTKAHITLTFCTIIDNSVLNSDGFDIANTNMLKGEDALLVGLVQTEPLPQFSIKASIVGGNDTQDNPIAGVITSGGYNVIQHMSSTNFDTSAEHATDRSVNDLTGVFGSHLQLQKNGGSTQTFALFPDPQDPTFNMIPRSVCQMKEIYDTNLHMYTDQRGMLRPGRNKQSCDSGAYESQR